MNLRDLTLVEFARAWQEERGASVADPDVVEQTVGDPSWTGLVTDEARLVAYSRRLLELRVEGEDGVGAVSALRGGLSLARWLMPLAGLVAGTALLQATLPPNDLRPVNVFGVLAEGIVLPGVFLVVTLLLGLKAGSLVARFHPLAALLGLFQGRALRTRVGALAGRVLRRSGVSGPLFAGTSHLFWICTLFAFLGMATWRFAFDDYLFSWSSTMPVTEEGVQRLFAVLAAPVGWLPGVEAPTADQVAVSQYASLEGAWPRTTGDLLRDDALRKGWYLVLLAVVAFWGLLPRVLGLAWAQRRLSRGIRSALGSSSNRAILDALAACSTTSQVGTAGPGTLDDALPVNRPADGAARAGQGLDVLIFATSEPPPGTLAELGLERLGLSGTVHRVPEDDDEAAMSATLELLGGAETAPGGAVVVFDVAATPGRVRERFLRDVAGRLGEGSPVHVLLTGVPRFRRSPRGRRFDARHQAWLGMAARAGVPAPFVHLDEEGS